MAEFKAIVEKFLISGMIILSLFSFIIITQTNNNAPDPITNEAIFNNSFSNLTNTIDTSTEAAKEKYGVFNSEEPQTGIGSIVLFGIVSVGKQFSSIIFGFFNIIIKLPLVVFGIPETIYSIILTWLIITVIVSVWLLYKFG